MKTVQFLILVSFICLARAGAAQTAAAEGEFLTQFPEYRKASRAQKNNFPGYLPLETGGLKRLARHDFRSKRAIEKRTYLRFSLSVFEYESASLARAVFGGLRRKITEGSYKSPEYILLRGEKIYWLSGACLYSRKNWESVEDKLLRAVLGETKPESEERMKIICGGRVL